jgi:hypothetical protein
MKILEVLYRYLRGYWIEKSMTLAAIIHREEVDFGKNIYNGVLLGHCKVLKL